MTEPIQKIIVKIINDRSIQASIRSYAPKWNYDDFKSYFYEQLCKQSPERLQHADEEGYLMRWAGSIIINSSHEFRRLYGEKKSDQPDKGVMDQFEMWGIIPEGDKHTISKAEGEDPLDRFESDDFPLYDDPSDDPEFFHTERMTIINNWKSGLKFYYHEIWRLHWEEGLSMKEISQKTGIPYSSIHYNLSKSKKMLQEHLKTQGLL